MPTSVPGICNRRGHRRARGGFTLVEVLVTIVVIAIGTSIAVVAWRGDPRADPDREARRFAGALEFAAARAQARHETLGVQATEGGHGWRFWRRGDDGAWTPLARDAVLDAHALATGLTLAPLAWAGQPVAADAVLPLRASGRNEPFAFVLRGDATALTIAVDPLNRATILREAG
ncbi:MAG: GspH/FimT family pseudopilin [Proteobacteria bacterium]|nr:GspH/FimT family pseudopilin [Pseudomonadota bacterium]